MSHSSLPSVSRRGTSLDPRSDFVPEPSEFLGSQFFLVADSLFFFFKYVYWYGLDNLYKESNCDGLVQSYRNVLTSLHRTTLLQCNFSFCRIISQSETSLRPQRTGDTDAPTVNSRTVSLFLRFCLRRRLRTGRGETLSARRQVPKGTGPLSASVVRSRRLQFTGMDPSTCLRTCVENLYYTTVLNETPSSLGTGRILYVRETLVNSKLPERLVIRNL